MGQTSSLKGEEVASSALVSTLNVLLEAERAGGKVLDTFLVEYDPGPARKRLEAVRIDEARYCAVLTRAIEKLGTRPSRSTGDFVDKAVAVQGKRERLAFLNRGQQWVVRKLDALLPDVDDPSLHAALEEMRDTHLRNIRLCERLQQCID